jgi:hypothetical protein
MILLFDLLTDRNKDEKGRIIKNNLIENNLKYMGIEDKFIQLVQDKF